MNNPDAVFIAHARQDIPWLLDALTAQAEQIAALQAERDKWREEADRRTHELNLSCLVQQRLTADRDAQVRAAFLAGGKSAIQRIWDFYDGRGTRTNEQDVAAYLASLTPAVGGSDDGR